ncbi:MAG: substrate-binding domain-containing protein [Planctomycetes bacterium]|nr:substrate-binding domain-containing protein [Planctomycetota bacterium]
MQRITLYSLLFALYFILSSCSRTASNHQILLATTTSVQDSGLLDVLIPAFEKASGFRIKPIAVGSGEAMAMGRRGDADVLLVHSPKDEEAFMNEGFGQSRQLIMTNTYIIVGPSQDPAGCLGTKSATEALAKIANTKSIFVSRADKSGTHKKEMSLWNKASITPTGTPYIQAQSGMGAVLQIADEKKGYTLTDRATYLAFKSKIALKIMVAGDTDLINYYSVIVPNPNKFPKMNLKGAESWADFLLASTTQKVIAEFGQDKFGKPLFYPALTNE